VFALLYFFSSDHLWAGGKVFAVGQMKYESHLKDRRVRKVLDSCHLLPSPAIRSLVPVARGMARVIDSGFGNTEL
jgi:hypothetical protein